MEDIIGSGEGKTVEFKQDIPNANRTVDVEQWRVGTGFEVGISYSL